MLRRAALLAGNLVRHRRGVAAVARRTVGRRLAPFTHLSWAEAKGIAAVRQRRVEAVRALADGPDDELLLAYDVVSRDVELLGFERGGFRWLAFPNDSVSRELFAHGAYQPGEVEAVLRWLEGCRGRRGTVVEVGANIGTTTLPLARAGWRVLALEPVPATHEVLRLNVERNGLADAVRVVPRAVSSSAGDITMALNGDFGQSEVVDASVTPGFGPELVRETITVRAEPLADILFAEAVDPADVALVWSDTQGHETTVIETGRPLWKAGTALYVEVWPRGLRAHGGTEPFVAAATECFGSFVTREDLLSLGPDAPPRPVSELATVIAGLQKNKDTDALLLPRPA